MAKGKPGQRPKGKNSNNSSVNLQKRQRNATVDDDQAKLSGCQDKQTTSKRVEKSLANDKRIVLKGARSKSQPPNPTKPKVGQNRLEENLLPPSKQAEPVEANAPNDLEGSLAEFDQQDSILINVNIGEDEFLSEDEDFMGLTQGIDAEGQPLFNQNDSQPQPGCSTEPVEQRVQIQ